MTLPRSPVDGIVNDEAQRILIVDADTRSASGLARRLEARGFQVDIEGDVHRAEQRLAGRGAALVLLNLTPLGRDGVRALERLKRRFTVPVLAMLSEIAARRVELAFRPEMPALNEEYSVDMAALSCSAMDPTLHQGR